MKLMQSGPETDAAGERVSKLIEKSNDLDRLKNHGLDIARKMDSPDARWVTKTPIVGSNRIENAKDWQLEIAEDCFLGISE